MKTGTISEARIKIGFDPRPADFPMKFPAGFGFSLENAVGAIIDYRGTPSPKTNRGNFANPGTGIRMADAQPMNRGVHFERTVHLFWMTRDFLKIDDLTLFSYLEAPLGTVLPTTEIRSAVTCNRGKRVISPIRAMGNRLFTYDSRLLALHEHVPCNPRLRLTRRRRA